MTAKFFGHLIKLVDRHPVFTGDRADRDRADDRPDSHDARRCRRRAARAGRTAHPAPAGGRRRPDNSALAGAPVAQAAAPRRQPRTSPAKPSTTRSAPCATVRASPVRRRWATRRTSAAHRPGHGHTLYKHAIGGFQGKAGVMPAKGGPRRPLRQVIDRQRGRLHGRRVPDGTRRAAGARRRADCR